MILLRNCTTNCFREEQPYYDITDLFLISFHLKSGQAYFLTRYIFKDIPKLSMNEDINIAIDRCINNDVGGRQDVWFRCIPSMLLYLCHQLLFQVVVVAERNNNVHYPTDIDTNHRIFAIKDTVSKEVWNWQKEALKFLDKKIFMQTRFFIFFN